MKMCGLPNSGHRGLRTDFSSENIEKLFEIEEKLDNHNGYGVCMNKIQNFLNKLFKITNEF